MTQAYPLQWPHGRPRTKQRTDSRFSVNPRAAFDEMMDELARFGAQNVVVSFDCPLRRTDGTPYADDLKDLLPDPGVAVYFNKGKRSICLPCDQYRRPWENIRAIGKSVEALRAMERHGAHQILDQAFENFTALPSPDMAGDAPDAVWWVVLGVSPDCTRAEAHEAYKAACRIAGGATVEINAAWAAAQEATG